MMTHGHVNAPLLTIATPFLPFSGHATVCCPQTLLSQNVGNCAGFLHR